MSSFYKRVAVCYLLVVVLLFVCVARVAVVATTPKYSQAAESERSRKITFGYRRGTIFDCNMERLTNDRTKTMAVIFNTPQAVAALYNYFPVDEIPLITEEIRKNGFALRELSRSVGTEGIYCFEVTVNLDDHTLAKHLIGYTDDENKGVCGLQLAYNDILYSDKTSSVTFTVDGRGQLLEGEAPKTDSGYSVENSGIMLTLDKDVQRIAEQKALGISKGAIVITEVKSGKIRAMVSRPDFLLSRLGEALSDPDLPLFNRALSTYNVGSVFKPCVAAAGIEAGVAQQIDCLGYTNVDGLSFACHKTSGHGLLGLSDALKFSCNSYFYTYVQAVGGGRVLDMARKAGFEGAISLAEGIVCGKGTLGDEQTLLSSKRALANLSIGQGSMLLSPVALTNLYMAIAGDGSYRTPTLIEGRVKGGKLAEAEPAAARVDVMSKYTADMLKTMLSTVLEDEGTGHSGRPTLTTAAGKTGTAQTGIVKDGKKVTNSWFCGFFPLEDPKYAVTVLSENSSSGCGKVFADIADAITLLEMKSSE